MTKFFVPNDKFLPAIKPLIQRRKVIDCGCGDGHITDLLNQNNIPCVGVDYINFSERSDIIKADAITLVTPETLPLVCRPCAGDWYFDIFIKATHGILVMKPEHYVRDVLRLRKKGLKVTLIKKGVGDANESVYYIGDDMKDDDAEVFNFALVQIPCWDGPWWVEDKGGNYWHNYAGGMTPKSPKDKVFERVSTSGDFEALDWTKTNMIDNSKDSGWLSPAADFYGCDYMEHDRVATLYIKQKVETLMKLGWMRIASKNNWFCERPLTEYQRSWLENKGYELDRLTAASPYNGGNEDDNPNW